MLRQPFADVLGFVLSHDGWGPIARYRVIVRTIGLLSGN
jgi:hypothetical protein